MIELQKKSNFPFLVLLSISTFLTFWPTFQYPLVKKEDRVLQEQIQHATFSEAWAHYRHFAYHPLPRLSHAFDTFFWDQNLFGFRLSNTLLHLLLGIVYFYFLTSFFPKPDWCVAAALLLLLHPLQVENLLSYGGRSALLAQVSLLLSFYIARLSPSPSSSVSRTGFFLGFGLFQGIAFLSWEMLLLTPILLFFVVKHSQKIFLGISSLLAFGVAVIHFGIAYHQKTGWAGWQGDTLWTNIATRLPVIAEQWIEFFFPVDLGIVYTVSLRSFQNGLVWWALGILLLFGGAFFLSKVPFRGLWFGFLCLPFVFSFGPFPQKFVKQDGTMALFLMGISFWGVYFFSRWKRATLAWFLWIVILLCFAGLSWNLSHFWVSEQALWERSRNSVKGGIAARFQLGLFFLEEGQQGLEKNPIQATKMFRQARQEFEQLLMLPLDWEMAFWSHIKLSVLYLQENQDSQALTHLKEAEELGKQETRTLFLRDKLYYVYQNQAQIYDRRSHAEEAQKYWQKLIALYPQEIYPRMSLAFSQNQLGMPTQAINTLVEVLALDSQYYLARLQMGKIYFNLKEYELAKEQFLRVLEHTLPTFDKKETLYNLALTHHCLNEYEEEEVCFKKALATDATFWLVQRELALIEKRKGNIEEATEGFKRTLALLHNQGEPIHSPRCKNILLEISSLFLLKSKIAYEQKNFTKAREEVAHALEVVPDHPQALYEEAFLDKRFGNLSLAREKFLKLLEKNPSYYEAYRELGYISLQEKRREEGIQFFEQYLDKLPAAKKESRERIQQMISNYEWEIYLQQIIATVTAEPSDTELFASQELAALKKARENSPPENAILRERLARYIQKQEIEFHFNLAKKYLQNQAFDEALSSLEIVISLEEEHWEAYLLQGLILIQQTPEQTERIEYALQKATRHNSEHPQAFYVLGCYYQELGYQAEKQELPTASKKWFREAQKWFVLCLSKDKDKFYSSQIRIYLERLKEK